MDLSEDWNNEYMQLQERLKLYKLVIVHHKKIYIYSLYNRKIEETYYNQDNTNTHSSVLMGDKLILVGQANGKIVRSLNVKTKDFEDLFHTTYSRDAASVSSLNDDIYVIGGCYIDKPITVEKFNLNERTITYLPNLLVKRNHHASAVLNKSIYVAGGGLTDTVECYDFNKKSWCERAKMVHKRSNFPMVAINNCLFVFGGNSYFNSIEKYDSDTDKWEEVSKLTNNYEKLGACLVGNKIIVIGGQKKNFLMMEEFDPQTYQCKFVQNLLLKFEKYQNITVHLYKQH